MRKQLLTLLMFAFISITIKAQTCSVTINGWSSVCLGSSTTFTATGATTYTWAPAATLNTTTGSVVTANPTVTTTYTVVASTGTCVASNTITITVNPLPSAPVLSNPTNNPIDLCQGSTASISVTPTGTVPSSPFWYVQGSIYYISGAGSQYTPNTSVVGTTVYNVMDSALFGCLSSPLTVTVTVNPSPTVTINSPISSGCVPVCTSFTSNVNIPATTYLWNFGNGQYGTQASPAACYTVAGTSSVVSLTVTTATGCTNIATSTVTTNPSPLVTYTLVADATPHVWDVYPTFSGGTPPYTYSWNWGDGSANSTVPYPSHTYSVAGTYSICATITDANGCTNTYCQNDAVSRLANNNSTLSSMVQINVLSTTMGIDEITGSNSQISIYPNPAQNSITVSGKQVTEIQVMDVLGQVVITIPTPSPPKEGKVAVDISNLQNGVYFVRVGSSIKKFIKE